MTIISYIIFNLLFFLFFRGLVVGYKIIYKKKFIVDQINLFNLPVFIFNQVFSLFILGNLSIILNFFFPIKELAYIFLGFFLFSILLNFYEKFNFDNLTFVIISFLIVPSILSLSSYGLKLHFDAIDYHLNFQYWVRESKSVFGLTNLYIGYGWSTIYDYILSNFWFGDNFILLHFVNLLFFGLFYNFIIYNLVFSKDFLMKIIAINITLFGLLDNFGIGGGANGYLNIQMIGKPDLSTGILFFICFVFFINDYIKDKFEVDKFVFISLLSLFAFQIKVVSGTLIILLIYYFAKLIPKNSLSLINKKMALLYLFFLSFIIKNIFISGCLIYPLSFTCLETFYWSEKNTVAEYTLNVSSGNNFALTNFGQIDVWFNSWISHAYNYQVYTNFLISFLLIFIFNRLFFIKNFAISKSKKNILYGYCIFLLIIFFYTGPTVRYGYGLFLVFIATIGTSRAEYKYKNISKKIESFYIILILITLLLTPRIYSYQEFITSPFNLYKVVDSTEEYLKSDALKNEIDIQFVSSKCFIVETCIKNKDYKKIKENLIGTYTVYYFDK